MIDALGLSPRNRQQRLAAAAKTIQHHQVRIARARHSHIKTRLERLTALNIDLKQLPCCIPPDGYG